MEEKIYTICAELKIGEITVNEATDRLLILFDVIRRRELLVDFADKVVWKDHRVHIHTNVIEDYLKSPIATIRKDIT